LLWDKLGTIFPGNAVYTSTQSPLALALGPVDIQARPVPKLFDVAALRKLQRSGGHVVTTPLVPPPEKGPSAVDGLGGWQLRNGQRVPADKAALADWIADTKKKQASLLTDLEASIASWEAATGLVWNEVKHDSDLLAELKAKTANTGGLPWEQQDVPDDLQAAIDEKFDFESSELRGPKRGLKGMCQCLG
jgi:hypothetical protein